ncbi:SIR2 family protein [Kordiimonas aquimaris]|uniref:hypothetical protein n=1 Tax=Kordiimonas aquimaris TaxID=707591 RepID=UPI0021D1F64E|nr:hypothetical protein [Kordiimonas aquimaris]
MSIQTGRIFILGAGFSAGAGIPLTNKLLPEAVRLFRKEAPGLLSRVEGYADQIDVDLVGSPDAKDFARLCTYLDFVELREHAGGERWSDQGSRERMALKFFLAKAIASSTPALPNIPDYYKHFASKLTSDDIVLTFNWDTLLEMTLRREGLPYSYGFEDDHLDIMKMHGSVHWIQGQPTTMGTGGKSFGFQPIGYSTEMQPTEIYTSDALENSDKWDQAHCLTGEVKPLLVLPGYGKTNDLRLLSTLWYRPEFLNIRQGGISIIGLSVSEDDYIVDSLFRYLFRGVFSPERKIRIINPDANASKKFKALAATDTTLEIVEKNFDSGTVPFSLHEN